MQQVVSTIGLISSLCGLGLMMRFGFRFHSRLKFDGTMPASDLADPQVLQQHNKDVKGRFGFLLVVLGLVLLVGASYCVWTRG